MKNELEFYAPCAKGLEELAAEELRGLCRRVRPLQTGVSFFGSIVDAYRVCLFSRVSSRVLMVLTRGDAADADTLYSCAYDIPWEEHLAPENTISVDVTGVNDALRNSQFSAQRIKDALCDRMREKCGARPSVEKHDPDIAVVAAIRGTKVTIYLNLSGAPLHQRGYRVPGKQVAAPLKETLAAGMLMLAGWGSAAEGTERAERAFLDPLCGSGTLAIEAAMIAGDIAPGIVRSHWGFAAWKQHDAAAWDTLLDEADARMEVGLERMPAIYASDLDSRAIELAEACARRAGLAGCISFAVADAADAIAAFGPACVPGPDSAAPQALIAFNPPYGERLSTQAQLPALYAVLGAALREHAATARLAIITPDENIDPHLGLFAATRHALYNGRIPVYTRLYEPAVDQRPAAHFELGEQSYTVLEENTEQFANRLKKRAVQMRKWARREGVSCYRIYDADLPDYNVAIDLYLGAGPSAGQQRLGITEYAPPKDVDRERAQRRLADVLNVAPAVLGVDPADVFMRVRDTRRPEKLEEENRRVVFVTEEHGHLFELNLSDYLDTGLFLDHRPVRALIEQMVAKRVAIRRAPRFLNLFCYTGSATVHAAAGGAFQTTSVDMSQTYLDWAQRNMELNGFTGEKHEFIRADCVRWVTETRHTKLRWDLIFVDPPTFSNSKKMGERTWDVQRDHAELLIGVSRLLTREGVAIFSCNLRNFKPDTEALAKAGVVLREITEETIDEDFARNTKIHKCYLMRRS